MIILFIKNKYVRGREIYSDQPLQYTFQTHGKNDTCVLFGHIL